MKKLIIINGTMGVGKSTVSEILSDRLEPSVFLDGDWCWKMNPWNITEENKKMVIDNITYLLNAYLKNSGFQYIVFCWVIHQEYIFEQILSRLNTEYELHKISLICTEEALRVHIMKDVEKGIRTVEQIETSTARLKLYKEMNTTKIDVSSITASQAADRIIDRVK
ncbi:nucleotide kinase [Sporolactobacillus shoreae]|uniref:Nucleotide kinase n=1 Tax=Sporolactobacillus shoreae TaxID=1465501 RepID=A0A4Z0GRW9_9BACL|nr:AAA family ATPase [Sporolactobacillus shoreae]TGA98931.1 nucleotide kinase [Sporolactobacillus shoreae]